MNAAGLKDFAVGAAILIATAGVVYVIFKGVKTAKAVTSAAKTGLNPANPQNYVNRVFTAAGAAVTGDKDFSLGTYFYDLLHPSGDFTAALVGQPPPIPLPPALKKDKAPGAPEETAPWWWGGGYVSTDQNKP